MIKRFNMNKLEEPLPNLALIVAVSDNNVIGIKDDLPWKLSSDLKKFKALTTGSSVIMGRKTFDTIGRLLPNRNTIIVTRNPSFDFEGATIVHSIIDALEACQNNDSVQLVGRNKTAFLIGGAEIYKLGIEFVNEIYLTRVHAEVEGDTFFPHINWNQFKLMYSEEHKADENNEYDFSLMHYHRTYDRRK